MRTRMRWEARKEVDIVIRSADAAVVFIANRQQGGRQGNRKLLNRVKSVLDTLCRVKKCILLKLEKLTVNFSFTKINC